MFHQPTSSPQRTRMFGLPVFAMYRFLSCFVGLDTSLALRLLEEHAPRKEERGRQANGPARAQVGPDRVVVGLGGEVEGKGADPDDPAGSGPERNVPLLPGRRLPVRGDDGSRR